MRGADFYPLSGEHVQPIAGCRPAAPLPLATAFMRIFMRVKCACGRAGCSPANQSLDARAARTCHRRLVLRLAFSADGGAARQAGFDVTVATRVRKDGARLQAECLRVISLEAERGSSGVLAGLRNLARTIEIVRAERPDVVQCVALRPVVVGGIATKLGNADALILAPTGLGHLWVEQGWAICILRGMIRWIVGSMQSPIFQANGARAAWPRRAGALVHPTMSAYGATAAPRLSIGTARLDGGQSGGCQLIA